MKQKSLRKDWPVIPVKQWDRGNLLEWRASLPKARRIEDHDLLTGVFAQAARVPMLRDALKWAENHNIDFIVDHTTTAGGYYTFGTGVVAIAKLAFRDIEYAVGVTVHEICHAKQDHHGLFPVGRQSFAGYYMREALCEADATTHQRLAERQYALANEIRYWEKRSRETERIYGTDDWVTKGAKKAMSRVRAELDAAVNDTGELWKRFKFWYIDKARHYGEASLATSGSALGVPGMRPTDYKVEYEPEYSLPREGVDISSFEGLQALSRSFNGRHYFNTREAREFLARTALSPDRAANFFSSCAEQNTHRPEINEIRRRQLLLKHHLGRDVMI